MHLSPDMRRRHLLAWGLTALASGGSAAASGPAPGRIAPLPAVELNSASLAQLSKLPGIGVEQAQRIIAARPYLTKTDLATREVIPTGVYLSIRKLVYVRARLPAKR